MIFFFKDKNTSGGVFADSPARRGRLEVACREGMVQTRSATQLRSSGPRISRQGRLLIWSRPLSSRPRISLVLYHSDGDKLQALMAVHLQPQSVQCQNLRPIL